MRQSKILFASIISKNMYFIFKQELIDYDFFNSHKSNTILFLHGWGGNKFSFNATLNLLKHKFNILTLTMPTISPTAECWNLFDYLTLVETLLKLHNVNCPIIVCHSFGFRIAMLLNKKIAIKKVIVTGGAGPKKFSIFNKISQRNNKILLSNKKMRFLFQHIASNDYKSLSNINKQTFKNVVNLNLRYETKFNCPMLLFWGKKDTSTPLWIFKLLKKQNNCTAILNNSDHFAYIKENSKFNNEIIKFLKPEI